MDEKELDYIISQLNNFTSRDDAFIDIKYDEERQEMHFLSNKDGLMTFAIELLRSTRNFDKFLNQHATNVIPFDKKDWFGDGLVFLCPYIKPIVTKRNEIKIEQVKTRSTFFSKLKHHLAIILFLLILVSLIIGFIDLFKWIFR